MFLQIFISPFLILCPHDSFYWTSLLQLFLNSDAVDDKVCKIRNRNDIKSIKNYKKIIFFSILNMARTSEKKSSANKLSGQKNNKYLFQALWRVLSSAKHRLGLEDKLHRSLI